MYPLDPRKEEIFIEDIAHALSNLCRFNGHVKKFYSVAEHCVHVSSLLPAELRLAGLLHDASEAYLCDMPRPIKRSNGFADLYLKAEEELMFAICDRFDFEYPLHSLVHTVDNRLLATEAIQLMAPIHPDWKDHYEPVDGLLLTCWEPSRAKGEFLSMYRSLVEAA